MFLLVRDSLMLVIIIDMCSNRRYHCSMGNTTDRYPGMKIRDVLDAQGRRQDWLAREVGVSPATVNRWLKGYRSVSPVHAGRVAAALGVPFFFLFDVPIGTDDDPSGSSLVTQEAVPV